MSSIINTNSLSLLTQNNLLKSQSALTTAIQRLSSGLRINSAKDDAAGQAIANRFSSNIKGLSQAQRNANDGISLAQTTEGALNEINNNLQRVRELTVQAANGSNSKTDLDSIQSEITQRMAEIDRTSAQTDFNGTKVLGAAASTLKIQVGANDGETIDIGLKTINTTTLGVASFNVNGTGTANTAAARIDLTAAGFATNGTPVNGTQQYDKTTTLTNALATSANVFSKLATGDTVTYAGTNTGYGAAATGSTYTYNAASSSFSFATSGVTNAATVTSLTPATGSSTAATVKTGTGSSTQSILISSSGNITAADDGATLYLDTVGNLSKTNTAGAVSGATLTSLVDSMDKSAGGGSSNLGSGGTIVSAGATLTAAPSGTAGTAGTFGVAGATISASALKSLANVTGYTASIAAVGTASSGTATVAAGTAAAGGTVTGTGFTNVTASGAFTASTTTATTETYYEHSNGAVMDNAGNNVYADSANTGKFTLNARSGSTSTINAMTVIDAALAKVDALRGSLGAVQNRFDSVISNLGSTVTNLSASRSRIEDADYATEVSNMTRAQILQQAGTSVLAKANQSTQGVMSLLQ